MTQHLVNPFGWRKWSLAAGVIVIATFLAFDTLAGGDRYMTAEEWSWFVIRIVFLYVTGNVSKEAISRFFGDKGGKS